MNDRYGASLQSLMLCALVLFVAGCAIGGIGSGIDNTVGLVIEDTTQPTVLKKEVRSGPCYVVSNPTENQCGDWYRSICLYRTDVANINHKLFCSQKNEDEFRENSFFSLGCREMPPHFNVHVFADRGSTGDEWVYLGPSMIGYQFDEGAFTLFEHEFTNPSASSFYVNYASMHKGVLRGLELSDQVTFRMADHLERFDIANGKVAIEEYKRRCLGL